MVRKLGKILTGDPDHLGPDGRFAYNKYKERLARQQTLYSTLKEKYPNKEFIMGGHSYGGSLIKGLSIDNNKDFKGYTYNSWFHPEGGDDHDNIESTIVGGDIMAAIGGGGDFSNIDFSATKKALKGVAMLAGWGYVAGVANQHITDWVLGKVYQYQDEGGVLGEGLLSSKMDAWTHIEPYLKAKKAMEDIKRSGYRLPHVMVDKARDRLRETITTINEHQLFIDYREDYFEMRSEEGGPEPHNIVVANAWHRMIRDLSLTEREKQKYEGMIKKERRLLNTYWAFKKLGKLWSYYSLFNILKEFHSSRSFKPVDKTLAMWDYEKDKEKSKTFLAKIPHREL